MKKSSLTQKTVGTTLISCIILGMTALLTGLAVFASSLVSQYVQHGFEVSKRAANTVKHGIDSFPLAEEVMEIYEGLSPEERALCGTQEYRSFFSEIDTRLKEGGTWDVLVHMMDNFVINVDTVYLSMYDPENCALISIADSAAARGEEGSLYPGDWKPASRKTMDKIMNWDGEGMLYSIARRDDRALVCTCACPVPDDRGVIREIVFVDVTVKDLSGSMWEFVKRVSACMLIITLLIAWYTSRRMQRSVTEPIKKITGAAEDYVRGKMEDTEKIYFSGLDIHTDDELENLGHVLADMETSLARHEDHIRQITGEKERINSELSMATRIQAAILPHTFPPFPDRKEFDIYASMEAAREVGGDFYDFFLIDEDHLGLVMADVSGKGIPAALFMMISKTIIKSIALMGEDVETILTRTNDTICANNQVDMFVTVWAGILEISTGKLKAVNAGHEYPILKKREGPFEIFKDRHGFVIGGMAGMKYRPYELTLEKGDRIFLYTDGIPEASDSQNTMYGMDRLCWALNEDPEAGPEELIGHVRSSVSDFVKDAEQFDDMTMMCLEYRGTGKAL